MSEKKYIQGFRTFPANRNAPDFVLGELVVTPDDFFQFCSENKEHMTEYQGKKQLRISILKGKEDSVQFRLNTWKPTGAASSSPSSSEGEKNNDGLPF